MVEDNHNVVNLNATDLLIKGSHGVITGIHVLIHENNAYVHFRNGTDASAPIEFTVYLDHAQDLIQLNRRFENGIFADVTGSTCKLLVVYK